MKIARRLSINLSKRVLGDASNSVGGSNTQWRRKSFAATVPSDSASKEERREMAEAFVNKYRAMNGGKFPPPKAALREVGGSYYTVKKIVQELQFNAKMPVDKDTMVKEASAGKAAIRKNKLLTKVEETLSSAKALEHGESEDGQLTNGILLEKEFPQKRKPSLELKEIPSDLQTVDGGTSEEAQSLNIVGVEGGDTDSNREAEAKIDTPIAADQTFLQEMSGISEAFESSSEAKLDTPIAAEQTFLQMSGISGSLLSHPFITKYSDSAVDLGAFVRGIFYPTQRMKDLADFWRERIHQSHNNIFSTLSNIRKTLAGEWPPEKLVHVVEKLQCRAHGQDGVAIRVSGSFIVGNQFLICGDGMQVEGLPNLKDLSIDIPSKRMGTFHEQFIVDQANIIGRYFITKQELYITQ